MARETGVQSQVKSYQRLKKWCLMPPCLTLNIIRYGSRVNLSNPGKGVTPSPTPRYSSYQKGSLRVTFDYCSQLYFIYIYIYMCVCVCVCVSTYIYEYMCVCYLPKLVVWSNSTYGAGEKVLVRECCWVKLSEGSRFNLPYRWDNNKYFL